jgi:23S rRNA (uracil1939-C5)-methyltransferase
MLFTSYPETIDKLRTDFSTSSGNGSFSCRYFPGCSGCKFQKNLTRPPIWEKVLSYFESKGFKGSISLTTKEIMGWRSKIKLAVRGLHENPQIGLFEENTHKVVDIPECPMHYPEMNEALRRIKEQIILHKIIPYSEETLSGRLRYIQMVRHRKSGCLQVVFVINGENLSENERAFVKQLYNQWDKWHSIWISYLPEATNRILGDRWEKIYGEEEFWQEIFGKEFCFHPSCFSQAHLPMFEEMLFYLKDSLTQGQSVLELYAGVGVIGMILASISKKVKMVESSLYSKVCFEKSCKRLSNLQEKLSFFREKVEDCECLFEGIETVVVDPPRKGLSKEIKRLIFDSKATELLYISCGFDSFMRDCDEFLNSGWLLEKVGGFLLFPGTDHVEIIAKFKRTIY